MREMRYRSSRIIEDRFLTRVKSFATYTQFLSILGGRVGFALFQTSRSWSESINVFYTVLSDSHKMRLHCTCLEVCPLRRWEGSVFLAGPGQHSDSWFRVPRDTRPYFVVCRLWEPSNPSTPYVISANMNIACDIFWGSETGNRS
jgi:hypothetical protein